MLGIADTGDTDRMIPEVLNNAAYQAFQPKFDLSNYQEKNYLMYDKYKYIYEGLGGQANEVGIAKLFADNTGFLWLT